MKMYNQDIIHEIMLHLEDVDIENLREVCRLYRNDIYTYKLKLLYPDFPLVDHHKAIYYKLKYNKWQDLVIWSDNKPLSAWILNQQQYIDYFVNVTQRYLDMIKVLSIENKYKACLDLFLFFYNNRLHVKKYPRFRNMVIIKLIQIKYDIPIYTDLLKMYLQEFKND